MSGRTKLLIVALVVAATGAVLAVKHGQKPKAAGNATTEADRQQPAAPAATQRLPRLVDLGSDKCIPCTQMAPILDKLSRDFAGKFEVEFIDVLQDKAAGKVFGIRVIPTQVFFDDEGQERGRHEGFFSRAQILAKWRELGYAFQSDEGPSDDR